MSIRTLNGHPPITAKAEPIAEGTRVQTEKAAAPSSERARTTAERGERISGQLEVTKSAQSRLSQLNPSPIKPEPLVCQRSTLKSGSSVLGKVLLAGGLAVAGLATGGVGLVLIGGLWLGGKLINRAVNGPLMRWMTFGDEQSRKDVNLPEAKGQIREMGNAKAITVRASAAEVMKGHFFSPADSLEPGKPDISKPVVLLLTGTAGCAEVQGRELAEMYSHGAPQANVLSVNYRGFGESDGGLPSRQSVYEDGHAMFNELLNMGFKPEQIVVHGYSMGATVAAKIQESAQRQGMRLKAVVLDRPMTSVFEAAKAHTGGGFVGSAAGKVARWGVGAMDCLAKVKGLEPESAPPMLVTYDAETLGPGSQRLGETVRERLGSDKVRVKSTDAEHLDNAQTILHLRQDYKRLLA